MKNLIFLFSVLLLASSCQTLNKLAYEGKCTSGNWNAIGQSDGARGHNQLNSWKERCTQFGTTPNATDYNNGFAQGKIDKCGELGNTSGAKGESLSYPATCTTSAEKTKFRSEFTGAFESFCSEAKGLEEARTGIDKHASCKTNKNYMKGYKEGLTKYCDPDRFYIWGTQGKETVASRCPWKMRSALKKAWGNGQRVTTIRSKIADAEIEISKLEPKMYDTNIPADARGHYKEIVAAKRNQIKALEKEMYSIKKQ